MPSPKMCEFHMRGACRYGVNCWYSHDLETSMERIISNATTKAYDCTLTTHEGFRESTAEINGFIAELQEQERRGRIDESSCRALMNTLNEQLRAIHILDSSAWIARRTPKTKALIAQVRAQDLCEKPSQSTSSSTNSTNALIAQVQVQNHSGRPAQSTSIAITNALNAQLRVQNNCASPAQSNNITTNALIAQVRVQDLCAKPSQSTSTSTNSTNALNAQVQAQELQLQLEASMQPIYKQFDNSKTAMGMVADKLSVEVKTGNGNSKKETASNFHALHQKNMKESTENDGSVWEDILLSAIDSDLLCNICFEIFIKPTVLNCSHTFCESCILVWTNRVIACPICRMEVKSKSYCLTLESFIEKIVEHLPKEIKEKREVTIKERINMKIERPLRVTHRLSRNGLSGLMFAQQRADAAIPISQFRLLMDRNVDFNRDVLVDESEIFRMNLHDTVVSTGGINPLMSYVVDPEEQTLNRRTTRPYNSSTRH